MNEIIEKLKVWSKGKESGPYAIDLNPTDDCNLKCLSCWQRNSKFSKLDSKRYQLSDEKLLNLIDEGFELRVGWWEITGGGEPLLRSITPKLMKKIKGLKMHGSITTNGTLFSEGLLKDLVKISWDKITFSIDGPDASTNDYLRGKNGALNSAIKALKTIKRLKSRFKKQTPMITFNTVLSNKNYDKTVKIIKLAKKVGCSEVNFEPITIHSELGEKLKLNLDQTRKFQQKIKETQKTADKLGIKTNIQGFKEKRLIEKSNSMQEVLNQETKENSFFSITCYEPWYRLVIKVDGTAGPCCIYDDKRMNVKNQTLKEIWFSRRFNKIRKRRIKKKFSKYCSICNAGQVLTNRALRKELKSAMTE
jgi:MoaA/NifB/PqqE/SkfB family radical SAM enzyme